MKRASLSAEVREGAGTGVARSLRRAGKLPAVLYGHGEENINLAVDEREFMRLYQAGVEGKLVDLAIAGRGSKTVLVKDVQVHPIRGNVIHVDFQAVRMTEKVTTKVPVVLVNEEKKANDGGIVEHLMRELEIRALPADIPERIEVDLTGLGIGDSVTVGDLKIPAGVEVEEPGSEVVVTIVAAQAARGTAEETTEAAPAEGGGE